ncbi:MAG: hypothetical protein ACFFAH_02620 [Promethearchaeota archaeon]
MPKNFHQIIKELEEKLGESLDSLYSFNLKYRTSQDKIDKLNKIIFSTKVQLLELVYSLNELLTTLDLSIHKIKLDDVKKLDNVELLYLINNALRIINTNI